MKQWEAFLEKRELGTPVMAPYYMAQVVKIGETLQTIYRQKNYVGEVDKYFTSDLWHEFLEEIIKPCIPCFTGKLLMQPGDRNLLERKATFGDLFASEAETLDAMLMDEPSGLGSAEKSNQPPPNSPESADDEELQSHAIVIDQNYIDNAHLDPTIEHDLNDMLRDIHQKD